MLIKFLGHSPIIYLRSDGFGEYKAILGKIGPIIYYAMFSIATSVSKLISVRKYILKGKKGVVIHPSQLDSNWIRKSKTLI